MIKIIREGKKPERTAQKYTITCNICGCIFECDISDFESQDKCLYGNGYVRCPTCQQLITISNLYKHKEMKQLDDVVMAKSRHMRNEIFKAYESSENKE